jgi:hypothetical protein
MGEIAYCKCPCKECGNNIEFPAYAARTTVPCPHCGQWTELLLPETVVERKRMDLGTIAIICCALLVAGYALWMQFHKKPAEDDSVRAPVVKVVPKPVAKVVVVPTNLPPTNVPPPIVVTQAVVQAPVTPTKPKSPDDLKIGKVELEKTPGNSLVYAVGTVKNNSDWQRFGVKIELDLLDAKGDKIGNSQDYKDILEPHQDWQFRALIPNKRTASAKVTSLKEQD